MKITLSDVFTGILAVCALTVTGLVVKNEVSAGVSPSAARPEVKFLNEWRSVAREGTRLGRPDAPVQIIEFSDFQCPFCSRAHDTVEEVMSAYAGKIRLVFRHFPLDFHAQAPKAAEASLCAHEQNKFWEYHDVLFKNQQKLQIEDLKGHATQLGLDAAKFNECLDSGRMAATVKTDTEAAKKVGVNGTPAFFINGQMISGAQPIDAFKQIIDAELATN